MLDGDKIRVMTKLAVFEKEKGAQADIASHYYRNDYVSYHMIWTGIATTVAYLLIIGLVVCCRLEYYVNHLQKMNFMKIGMVLAILYVCFLLFFEIMAFVLYRKRYKKSEEYLKDYCRELKELEKIYNKEHLRQTRATIQRSLNLEGTVSDDKFTGI